VAAATAVICGLGPYGYVAATDAVARMKQAGESYLRSSSSAKADDPVFQRRRWWNREGAAYWLPRMRGVWRLVVGRKQ